MSRLHTSGRDGPSARCTPVARVRVNSQVTTFLLTCLAVLVKQALRLFIVTSSRMNSNIKSGGKLVKDNINRDANPF